MKIKQIKYLVPLLLVVLIACGGGGDKRQSTEVVQDNVNELKEAVKNNVADVNKQAEINKIVDLSAAEMHDFLKLVSEYKKQMQDLSSSYDATEDQLAKLNDEFDARYRLTFEKVISNRRAVRNLVSPQEWTAIQKEMTLLDRN